MTSFTVDLPLFVEMGKVKKKRFYLNLNQYRNWPFHVSNNLKKEFKRIVEPLLPDVYFEKYTVTYTVYLPNKLKRDISNICSIVDKFFVDSLVELGKVPEDNYEHLPLITYKFGDISLKNGKVEALVTEVK